MFVLKKYGRELAVAYARKYALIRNEKYQNFEGIGGNCTNYISQCLFAGSGVMNYSNNGWFYKQKYVYSPSWTGVEFLHKFLVSNKTSGVYGEEVSINLCQIGDIVQLKFRNKESFTHSLIITKIDGFTPNKIYVCANSADAKDVLLSRYAFVELRFIHIMGYREEVWKLS